MTATSQKIGMLITFVLFSVCLFIIGHSVGKRVGVNVACAQYCEAKFGKTADKVAWRATKTFETAGVCECFYQRKGGSR